MVWVITVSFMKKMRPNLRQFFARQMQSGFTLIEVLVAVFIIGITLISGLRALSSLTQTSYDIDQRTLALWSADNILLEQKIQRTPFNVGEEIRDCPQGRFAFQCVIKVSPTPNPRFVRVEVNVRLDKDKGKDTHHLAQLFHVTLKTPNTP